MATSSYVEAGAGGADGEPPPQAVTQSRSGAAAATRRSTDCDVSTAVGGGRAVPLEDVRLEDSRRRGLYWRASHPPHVRRHFSPTSEPPPRGTARLPADRALPQQEGLAAGHGHGPLRLRLPAARGRG